MKIYFLSATFLFFCLITKAQKLEIIDTTQYIGMYNYTFQQDSSDVNSVKHQDMVLQIGHNYSKFCSENKIFQDSLLSVYGDEDPSTAITKILPLVMNRRTNNLCDYYVYKNYPHKEEGLFTGKCGKVKYKVNFPTTMNWKITETDSVISGYHCLKAFTSFAGRNYIAWFTMEIPIKDGPYKFNGLPGLIIKISDDQHQHVFELTGFQKLNSFKRMYYVKEQYANVTPKEFNKAFYVNIEEKSVNIQNGTGSITISDPESRATFLKNIRKINNLIERY